MVESILASDPEQEVLPMRLRRTILAIGIACVLVTPSTTVVAGPRPQGLTTSYQLYFGDLHTHTGYSDGVGTPRDAYAAAIAAGADFLATTEHDSYGVYGISPDEWQDNLAAAEEFTSQT